MKRLVSALAVVVLLLGVVPSALAAGPTRHFGQPKGDLSKIDPSFRPMLADANRKVTVVVELAPAPAAAPRPDGHAAAGPRAGRCARAQGKLDGRIKALGGRVLARYQYAYNGIKVQTTTARLTKLAAMPGVVGVASDQVLKPTNVNAVPYVGAPTAWQTSGATGAGQTIAVIDTGIDYTHANFGGAGTTAAYDANNPTIIEPGSFPTAKVIARLRLRRQRLRRDPADSTSRRPIPTRSTAASTTARTSPAPPPARACSPTTARTTGPTTRRSTTTPPSSSSARASRR